jgi:hypothetical protein
MSKTRTRMLAVLVILVGAAYPSAGSALVANPGRDECPVQGGPYTVCELEACNLNYNDRLWVCLEKAEVEDNPNCCTDLVGQGEQQQMCVPSICMPEADELNCIYWTYNEEEYCPFIEHQ